MPSLIDSVTIAKQPAKTSPEWIVDINKINELPSPAVVAIVQTIDLQALDPEAFRAIVAIIDNAGREKRRGLKP